MQRTRATSISTRRSLRAGLLVVGALLLAIPGLSTADESPAANQADFFEKTIRPLLVQRCQGCHGPDKQWASLRLDSRQGLLTGGDSGPAIVSGDPDQSELLNRVTETDDELRMPPAKAGAALTAEQIENLRRWIAAGAVWPETGAPTADRRSSAARDHWAFQPVKRVDPPAAATSNKVSSPVDRFILARLRAEELAPSPAADKRTLIRRATYDLTGLPPSPEETAAFIADDTADAYAQLVDRLLESPRYGENWGRYWLDVARYSDTKGYVYGREERLFVHASLYRDWVIDAFNRDVPYDRFLHLQVAADQLVEPNSRDLAALGLLTTGRRFLGVTPDIIDDRIDVVTRGLMGLTVSCARCHDHKYDPIPTADYYSLYGVFQNCVQKLTPVLPAPGVAAADETFSRELLARQQKLADKSAQRRAIAAERLRTRLADYLLAQRELDKYPELGFDQILEPNDLIPGLVRRWESYLARAPADDPIWGVWKGLARIPDEGFAEAAAAATQALVQSPSINRRVAQAFATPPASIRAAAERYAQLAAQIESEWKSLVESAARDNQPAPIAFADAADEAVRQMLFGPLSPCVIADEPIANIETLLESAAVNELWGLQNEIDRWLLNATDAAPHALVLVDREHAIDPQIFRRGNPANKGETVPRQVPAILGGGDRQPFQHGSGRLELAQAIAAADNPLTARVWVNRVWMHHFGAGLVATPSDFGTRAEPPSHPELLDWLTSEFIAHGWSTKWLHRTLMLSATYQQSSAEPADVAQRAHALERDPNNRLLWRMNARRLRFEQIRDTLVNAAGELDLNAGGRAVELFPAAGPFRRSVYGLIDRQFVPAVLRVFDFANPDLHSPQRSETTVPQQALFALNDPFVAGRARALAARVSSAGDTLPAEQVTRLYQTVVQRSPSDDELQATLAFLSDAAVEQERESVPPTIAAWSYGYGELDEAAGKLKSFERLPHFEGAAWQGGAAWPDNQLGWVQLTANGGHAGNDRAHAAIRRWTAATAGTISIESVATHEVAVGDGIRCWIVSSRHGLLGSAAVHNSRQPLNAGAIDVQAGDTIDFVVDLRDNLNSDQFVWAPAVKAAATAGVTAVWSAENDFAGPPKVLLSPLEQLAQLLLMSNEVMFVD